MAHAEKVAVDEYLLEIFHNNLNRFPSVHLAAAPASSIALGYIGAVTIKCPFMHQRCGLHLKCLVSDKPLCIAES